MLTKIVAECQQPCKMIEVCNKPSQVFVLKPKTWVATKPSMLNTQWFLWTNKASQMDLRKWNSRNKPQVDWQFDPNRWHHSKTSKTSLFECCCQQFYSELDKSKCLLLRAFRKEFSNRKKSCERRLTATVLIKIMKYRQNALMCLFMACQIA